MYDYKKTAVLLITVMIFFSCLKGNSQAYKSENPLADYTEFYPYKNGYATVGIKRKYGFIDKKGRNIVPCKYNFVYEFYKGLVVVELDGKHGLVDTAGREVVPLKYDFIGGFEESNRAIVKLNGKWGYIDKKGNEVIPVIYESSNQFYEDKTTVKANGQWSL